MTNLSKLIRVPTTMHTGSEEIMGIIKFGVVFTNRLDNVTSFDEFNPKSRCPIYEAKPQYWFIGYDGETYIELLSAFIKPKEGFVHGEGRHNEKILDYILDFGHQINCRLK